MLVPNGISQKIMAKYIIQACNKAIKYHADKQTMEQEEQKESGSDCETIPEEGSSIKTVPMAQLSSMCV